jgi:hypothetical protein
METIAWLQVLCERLHDNLEGLRLAGEEGVRLAREAIEDEPEAAAVLAILLALDDPRPAWQLLAHPFAEVREWANWGLRLAPHHPSLKGLQESYGFSAFDILAFHRAAVIMPSTSAGLPEEAAWFWLEGLGRSELSFQSEDVAVYATHERQQLRQAAWRCAARRRMPELVSLCRMVAQRDDAAAADAISFLGVIGSLEDLDLLQSAAAKRPTAKAALLGIGKLGHLEAIPFLLETLAQSDLSEWAAGSIERIVGGKVPRGLPPPMPPHLTEDEMDVWEAVAPVDPEAAAHWWRSRKHLFVPGGRWQCGVCVSDQPLREVVFDNLPLTVRYDVYLRERALVAGTPDWEMETWVWDQKNVRGSRQPCR